MGLRQTISEWVGNLKDALDFGPEFPTAVAERRAHFAEELSKLQHLLEETRKASEEKDELIAQLQATGAVQGNMVIDDLAYYIKRENALDGPFCLSCFQEHHETTRIVPAPQPEGADGAPTEWVQCAKCQSPFRSERIGQYLNPSPVGSTPAAPPETQEETKPAKPARKPRAKAHQPKNERSASPKSTARRRSAR